MSLNGFNTGVRKFLFGRKRIKKGGHDMNAVWGEWLHHWSCVHNLGKKKNFPAYFDSTCLVTKIFASLKSSEQKIDFKLRKGNKRFIDFQPSHHDWIRLHRSHWNGEVHISYFNFPKQITLACKFQCCDLRHMVKLARVQTKTYDIQNSLYLSFSRRGLSTDWN